MVKKFEVYFTEAEEKKLFSTIRLFRSDVLAWRDYNWMKLARGTGVRLCVLVGLTVGDAKKALETEYLHVRPEINKRAKAQEIYVVKSVRKALSELLKIHDTMAAGVEWEEEADSRPLMISRNRRGMSRRSFQSRMKIWVEIADLSGGSPHWWRHTLAKRMVKNCQGDEMKGLRRAQLVLGHSDLKTTQIYTAPDKEDMKEALINAT